LFFPRVLKFFDSPFIPHILDMFGFNPKEPLGRRATKLSTDLPKLAANINI
jgi:hypothetical protein